jgi:hypothetical protein
MASFAMTPRSDFEDALDISKEISPPSATSRYATKGNKSPMVGGMPVDDFVSQVRAL